MIGGTNATLAGSLGIDLKNYRFKSSLRSDALPETTIESIAAKTTTKFFDQTSGMSSTPKPTEAPSPLVLDSKLYLEDIAVQDHWWSQSREITGEDVAEFASLTGDTDPLHSDDSDDGSLTDSPFGGPIAHGLLGMSIMAGLSSDSPSMATLALVEVADWRFEAPIYFGDIVRVKTTVESISPHGRRAGRVVWRRQLFNQKDRVVQSGRIVSLVARKTRLSRSSANGVTISSTTRPNSPR